jgi:hypothetical protein
MYVIPNFKYPCLVGNSFLFSAGIILNYKQHKFTWGNTVLEMKPNPKGIGSTVNLITNKLHTTTTEKPLMGPLSPRQGTVKPLMGPLSPRQGTVGKKDISQMTEYAKSLQEKLTGTEPATESDPEPEVSSAPKSAEELTDEIMTILAKQIDPQAPPHEHAELMKLLFEYNDIFGRPGEYGRIRNFEYYIDVVPDARLPHATPRRLAPEALEFEKKTIEELLAAGCISSSSAPCSSPAVVVKSGHWSASGKKTFRLAIDYSQLNKYLRINCSPIPRMDAVLYWLSQRSQYMSVGDLVRGFHHITLHPDTKFLTSFISSATGKLYVYNVLPFGLASAAQVFQRVISGILGDQMWNGCVYIDDLIWESTTFDTFEPDRLKNHLPKIPRPRSQAFTAQDPLPVQASRSFRVCHYQ